jgi:UDP-N-acetylglucosamine 2-epimerase (non-hydrolysing)
MKIAPIVDAINSHNRSDGRPIDYLIVHTGQHYDQEMSKLFFEDLGIPNPDINLEVGSASHAVQTAEIMKRFEDTCLKENLTHVLVVGDVNSTIACSLVASKLEIKVIHVEAGLRSFDRSMPEEINRVLTDAISDLLFTTEESANENLRLEGIPGERIHFVGNVMIDTLLKHRQKAQSSNILLKLGLETSSLSSRASNVTPYGVLTLHRPSNVDSKEAFKEVIEALAQVAAQLPIIFPVHPRTLNRIKEFQLVKHFKFLNGNSELRAPNSNVYCLEPLGYLDFLQLMSNAKLVLTDSGGIQEETTILGIPCVTIRENTERPITVTHGTNVIAGVKKENIINAAFAQLRKFSEASSVSPPPFWDGKAAERIVEILAKQAEIRKQNKE